MVASASAHIHPPTASRPLHSPLVPVRLAVVSSEFPPKWGGVGNYTYHLVEAISPRLTGRIEVLARSHSGPPVALQPNVALERLPFLPLPMVFALSFGRSATERLVARPPDQRPDLVHVMSNMTLLPADAYERLGMPIVSTMHGTWQGERLGLSLADIAPNLQGVNDLAVLGLSPAFDRFEDLAIERSDLVTVQSANELRAVQRRIEERGLHPKGPVLELTPGVDTHTFSPAHRSAALRAQLGIDTSDLLVLCVARLAGRKGLEELVASFDLIQRRVPAARLVLAGEGPLEGRLRARAARGGFSSKVRFVCGLSIERLAALYASADLFLLLSRWEGFGLAPMESMASGVPVVSTDVGGIPEYVHPGGDGLLVAVGDVEGAAEAAVRLLEDEAERSCMGVAARQTILADHGWERVAERFVRLYERVLGRPLLASTTEL